MLPEVVNLRSTLLDRGFGQGNTRVNERYIPNADPTEHDPHKDWDLMVARAITRVLLGHYRGHFWEVNVSRKQGIASISIPILMGPTEKYFIRLSESITPAHIIRYGGELLERWNIPRSPMDLPAFLTARERAMRTFGKDKTPR
jgi:hypothetical protein